MTLAGIWIVGEYCDVLLQGGNFEEEDLVKEVCIFFEYRQGSAQIAFFLHQVKASDVIDLFESVLISPYCNGMVRQYVLVAATKASTRIGNDATQLGRIRALVDRFSGSVELDVQQRSVEFEQILTGLESIRSGVLERMPPPEIRATVMGTGQYFLPFEL